jgi:hypothetical protein
VRERSERKRESVIERELERGRTGDRRSGGRLYLCERERERESEGESTVRSEREYCIYIYRYIRQLFFWVLI